MKPTLLELEQDRVVYYDIDEALEERAMYEVRAVPTIILVDEEGKELKRVMGSQRLSTLQEMLYG
jgi:thioredoxin-related protein